MIEAVSEVLGVLMPLVLIAGGIYLGARLGFFYILHPKKTLVLMNSGEKSGISPFRAASMALAGTLGVGNITGVTAAIACGGAGAIFWMWLSAAAAMSLKYSETYLAVKYRLGAKGERYGGAPYYIAHGLKSRRAGAFFAVLCIIDSLTVGNIMQINAASSAAMLLSGTPHIVTGLAAAILAGAVVLGGGKRISNVTSVMIPVVSAIYIMMCFAVILPNVRILPDIFGDIFRCAFSVRSAGGGVCGYSISAAVRYGVTRGIITNEAGAGTSPTAHASSDTDLPEAQGALGIFEVFADTIVICTMTALSILIGQRRGCDIGGDTISSVSEVFGEYLGRAACPLLTAVIFVFVFSTLISQHYYGDTAIRYFDAGKKERSIYTLIFTAAIAAGAVMPSGMMWALTDMTVSVMAIFNVICLVIMRRQICRPDLMKIGRSK